MNPNQLVDSYQQEIAELAGRAEEARDRIKSLVGEASSPDGAVTVTVNGGGALQGISFGARADQLPKERLAAEIMAAVRRAQARASQQVLAIMGDLVGEDSAAMRFVEEQIPGAAEPEDEFVESYPGQQAQEEEPAPEPAPPPRPVARRPAVADDDDDYGLDSPLNREESW
jgi:DNA-binding protein YbaB